MMVALIYAKREHVYQVDTLSMMLTTNQWIPLDGLHELPLIEALQCDRRAFMKPLKYDARTAAAFPNVRLLDCGKVPLPMHVVSPYSEGRERVIKEKTVATKGEPTWVWYTDKDMPPLPERARNRVGGAGRSPWPPDGAHRAQHADGDDLEEDAKDMQQRAQGAPLTG